MQGDCCWDDEAGYVANLMMVSRNQTSSVAEQVHNGNQHERVHGCDL